MNSFRGIKEISNDSKLLILEHFEPGFNITGKNTPHLLSKESERAFCCILVPGSTCGPPQALGLEAEEH